MTRIDFYVLADGARDDRYSITCRLAEKIFRKGHRIYVHAGEEAEARHLDRLLWTFRDQSFLPHQLTASEVAQETPILIGWREAPTAEDDVLINLAPEVPEFFSRFERVAEPVDADAAARKASRNRYRFYRDRGYPLHLHEVR